MSKNSQIVRTGPLVAILVAVGAFAVFAVPGDRGIVVQAHALTDLQPNILLISSIDTHFAYTYIHVEDAGSNNEPG